MGKRAVLLLTVLAATLLAFSGVVLAQQDLPAPKKGEDDAFVPGEAEGAFVPGEILVKFNPGSPDRARAEAHRQNGGQVKETIRGLDVQVLGVTPGQERAQVAAYSRNPNVEYAELNGVATISADPNDPYDNTSSYTSSKHGDVKQWGWAKIKAYNAWDKTSGASTVKVAVVDSGIDNSHPDLPSVAAQKDFINNDSNAEDDNGHGTHVAGTIGASTNNAIGVAGANSKVSLLGAKALNASGSGSYSAISNAINWSADNGATAINLSLGGSTPSLTLENAVKYAWSKGSVLACAAGNSNTSQKSYPGAYANCIAVAATDEYDRKASFSNYGSWVDVAAPGTKILSTMPDTPVTMNTQSGYKTTYDSLNGTSMATPHVAGLAALVKASGTSGASSIRNKIESSATKRTVLSSTGPDWSSARINACKAVGGTGC